MGIPFFTVFVLSIAFLSLGITGWGDFVSIEWPGQDSLETTQNDIAVTPYLHLKLDYWAMAQCFIGFLLFLGSLYLMGFFLYLEERESGRIMKNVKSFAKLRQFLERHQKGDTSQ